MENLKPPLYFKDSRKKRHLHLRHCKHQHPHPLQQNTRAKLTEPLRSLTRSWLCCSSATSPLLSCNIAALSIAAAQASPTHVPGVAQPGQVTHCLPLLKAGSASQAALPGLFVFRAINKQFCEHLHLVPINIFLVTSVTNSMLINIFLRCNQGTTQQCQKERTLLCCSAERCPAAASFPECTFPFQLLQHSPSSQPKQTSTAEFDEQHGASFLLLH